MSNQLPITNIIVISVSQVSPGLGQYNTSNLALFTSEQPGSPFTNGFKIYLDPTEVATDFGSSSDTYKMALAVFSQQPNILAGGGYLVIIPLDDIEDITAVQHIAFSTVPASGQYKLKYGTFSTGFIQWNDNAAAVETALQTLTGLGSVTVAGDTTVGFDVTFTGVSGPATLLVVTNDSLQDSGPVDVFLTITTTTAGHVAATETLAEAITRTKNLVQYFGVMENHNLGVIGGTEMLAAAAVIQALNKIVFFVSNDPLDIESGGLLDELRTGGFTKSRGLYYGSTPELDSILMMAAYAGRGLSVDFNGSNTTITMNLKTLATIQPDPTLDQTQLELAKIAGADTYVSLQGVPVVISVGANRFFDQVYNQEWFVGALQVAGFNFLAQTGTKVPQTENGMDGLKGAYRTVCEQAKTNEYIAPGSWTSPVTFGNQLQLYANIAQRGYYIFSQPVAQQLQAAREAREAPLVQIALKEAGAVQSSNVLVTINA